MALDLAVLLGPATLWLAAGLLADRLSATPTTPRLRRRTGTLMLLVWGGLVGTGTATALALLDWSPGPPGGGQGPLDRAGMALLLSAVPAVVVAARTVRRLRQLRAAAGAFATAPDTPVPPALRAASAHPLVVLPVQLAGLTTLPAAGAATGAVAGAVPTAGPGMIGLVLTAIVAVAVATGVRHGLRHSRLVERAVTLRPITSRARGLLQA